MIRGRDRGAAAIEFLLAAWLVLLPLCAGLFEWIQLSVSRQLLQLALFEGVRAAAVSGADVDVLRAELARGLVPLFGPASDETSARSAYGRSMLEVSRPDLTRITMHSPRAASFEALSRPVRGDRWIPNEAMDRGGAERNTSIGARLNANLLDVEVHYCRRLLIPILDRLIVAALRPTVDERGRVCLAQLRVPVTARAATVMQSHASAQRSGVR